MILQAVVDSFTVIPINGQFFNWDSLAGSITQYMTDLFVIGFRIFLPIFACMMILNCILGILAKVAPQMNMFVVGMQLKIFVGIFVILFTISMLPSVSDFILDEIERLFAMLVRGMS